LNAIFIDFAPNIHAHKFYNFFSEYFKCELFFWQGLSLNEKNEIKKSLSKFDLLICADVFKLDDLLWTSDIQKVGISWTSDIVGLQSEKSINLRNIFELLVVDCDFSARKWQKLGVPDNRIFKMPYGINHKTTYNYNIKNRKNMISTRSWQTNYNQDILLESILQTNNFDQLNQFHFAGEGPTLEFLKDKYKLLHNQNSVKYLGYIPNEQIIDLISQYLFYISTSLSDGLSVSMLEAMAAGTPVLVSDIEPNIEFIKHGQNGLLFKSNSTKDLSRVIHEVFANEYDLKLISQNALVLIHENANWEENMSRLLILILAL
jgi:glycosyltransferase involved in cell wall biosynthesis